MTPETTKGTKLGHQVKCPMFMSGINQIWIF